MWALERKLFPSLFAFLSKYEKCLNKNVNRKATGTISSHSHYLIGPNIVGLNPRPLNPSKAKCPCFPFHSLSSLALIHPHITCFCQYKLIWLKSVQVHRIFSYPLCCFCLSELFWVWIQKRWIDLADTLYCLLKIHYHRKIEYRSWGRGRWVTSDKKKAGSAITDQHGRSVWANFNPCTSPQFSEPIPL